MGIRDELLAMQDLEYKAFHCKLIPNIQKENIIGIRVPALRKYAKSMKDVKAISEFMEELPHKYYEENNLHAFFIENISDYDACIEELDRFLPFVDNWATCDSMSPKILLKDKNKLIEKACEWMNWKAEYAVRFGIGILMSYYLDKDFKEEYLYKVAAVNREEYYIKMMQSWYYATALAKQYDVVIKLFEGRVLEPWIHNKSIQKAIESRRITEERKQYLRTLRRK